MILVESYMNMWMKVVGNMISLLRGIPVSSMILVHLFSMLACRYIALVHIWSARGNVWRRIVSDFTEGAPVYVVTYEGRLARRCRCSPERHVAIEPHTKATPTVVGFRMPYYICRDRRVLVGTPNPSGVHRFPQSPHFYPL